MRTIVGAALVAALPILAQETRVNTDPDSARLVTSDIRLFWDVLDRAPADSLAAWLQRKYIDSGSVGVRDFVRGRIISGEALAQMLQRQRPRYDSVRAATFMVDSAAAGIRRVFHRFKALYPEAVFPDVYFVIGRLNSGGTASRNGLLIGAEMYRSPDGLPAIVAHELIHFQQRWTAFTLLYQSFKEGSADFVAELIADRHINTSAHAYGRAHERELWEEFRARLDTTSYTGWMYGDPPGERPADLGYFIGYRIAQAYYNRMDDKAQALRDIINPPGGNVREILAASGYDP